MHLPRITRGALLKQFKRARRKLSSKIRSHMLGQQLVHLIQTRNHHVVTIFAQGTVGIPRERQAHQHLNLTQSVITQRLTGNQIIRASNRPHRRNCRLPRPQQRLNVLRLVIIKLSRAINAVHQRRAPQNLHAALKLIGNQTPISCRQRTSKVSPRRIPLQSTEVLVLTRLLQILPQAIDGKTARQVMLTTLITALNISNNSRNRANIPGHRRAKRVLLSGRRVVHLVQQLLSIITIPAHRQRGVRGINLNAQLRQRQLVHLHNNASVTLRVSLILLSQTIKLSFPKTGVLN